MGEGTGELPGRGQILWEEIAHGLGHLFKEGEAIF